MNAASDQSTKFNAGLIPTIISLISFAVCIALGVWQIQRMHWKNDLIAKAEAGLKSSPKPFASDATYQEFEKLEVSGVFIHDKEMLFGQYYGDQWGYKVVTPLKTQKGKYVFINRGWIPKENRDASTRSEQQTEKPVTIVGLVRLGNKKGLFTPENDAAKNFWFWFDITAMKSYTGLENATDFVIEKVATDQEKDARTLPIPAKEEVKFYNAHLAYVITWFGIALSILVIYIAYGIMRAKGKYK